MEQDPGNLGMFSIGLWVEFAVVHEGWGMAEANGYRSTGIDEYSIHSVGSLRSARGNYMGLFGRGG